MKKDKGNKKLKNQKRKKTTKKVKYSTIPESVFKERNLSGFIETVAVSTNPIFQETEHGTIRIEGEVTPQKLALADNFNKIFEEVVSEIENLSVYVPDPEVMNFLENSSVTAKQVKEMVKASDYSVFEVKGRSFIKVPGNKIQEVKTYIFGLEKATLTQIKARQEQVSKTEEALNRISVLEASLVGKDNQIQSLEKRLNLSQSRSYSKELALEALKRRFSVLLKISKVYDTLKTRLTDLFSKKEF